MTKKSKKNPKICFCTFIKIFFSKSVSPRYNFLSEKILYIFTFFRHIIVKKSTVKKPVCGFFKKFQKMILNLSGFF